MYGGYQNDEGVIYWSSPNDKEKYDKAMDVYNQSIAAVMKFLSLTAKSFISP